MASRPAGRSTRAIPSRTARLVVSSKYPNAVDQFRTRSKRPVHGSWRMSPVTESALIPAAAASARARSKNTAEESRPVTWQPRAANRVGQLPVPARQIQHAHARPQLGQPPGQLRGSLTRKISARNDGPVRGQLGAVIRRGEKVQIILVVHCGSVEQVAHA